MSDRIMKEWDEGAEGFSRFVREGKDYFRDELNNPATFELIGGVEGKAILDLSCGEGHNTRILARKGAFVVGIDFSENLIRLAKELEKKENLGIIYHVCDATNMKVLSSSYFDLVTCFMALHDIEHYADAVSEVARVLKEKCKFVFSLPHPCFVGHVIKEGEEVTGYWIHEEENEEQPEKRLVINDYFGIGKYDVEWDMDRINRPFKTTAFHRTLTDYFRCLHDNGFVVSRLVEPMPSLETVSRRPSLRKRLRIPQSMIIEAIRTQSS